MANHHSRYGPKLGRYGPGFPVIFGTGAHQYGIVPVSSLQSNKYNPDTIAIRFLGQNGIANGIREVIDDAVAGFPKGFAFALSSQDPRGVNALFFRITIPGGQKVFVMGFKNGRCVAVKSLAMGIVYQKPDLISR